MLTSFQLMYIGVMLGVYLADICWTFYFIESNALHTMKASFWSMMIIAAGAYSTTEYVKDYRLISAAVIGAGLGTATAIEWKKYKKNHADKNSSL